MIVTDLIPISKGRYKVYIDQEFAFVLYKGELHVYELEVGAEVDDTCYKEIVSTVLPKRAKLRAMNLLQKRTYTTKQLRDKLKEGFYPEEIIEEAIAYVSSYHYLDDHRYALDYITYHAEMKSEKKLQYDLLNKGVPADIIAAAFDEWREQGGDQNEIEMIRKQLEKKKYSPDCDIKEKQKVYSYLLRKGFSLENVNKVLGRMDSFA